MGEVGLDWFSIYLIPETLRVTILGEKREGDVANIEIEAQTQVEMASSYVHTERCACQMLCMYASWLTLPADLLCRQLLTLWKTLWRGTCRTNSS